MNNNLQSSPYIAQPPRQLKIGWQSFKTYLLGALESFGAILLHTITPYDSRPEVPLDPPSPSFEIDNEIVEQCRKIYEDTEATRTYLEDKARATFTFTSFFVPFMISAFSYALKDLSIQSFPIYFFGGISGILLILAFISVSRAVSVQSR